MTAGQADSYVADMTTPTRPKDHNMSAALTAAARPSAAPVGVLAPSRARLVAFRCALVFAGLIPAVWGSTNAVMALQVGPHVVHEVLGAGAVLFALLLTTLAAMWRPARRPGALPIYLSFVAGAGVAALLSASNLVVMAVFMFQAALIVALHPSRREGLRGVLAVHPVLLPLSLLAAGVLVRYAVAEAALQATGDAHAVAAHYFDQAWYAVTVGLVLLIAALRDDARRLAGRIAGVGLLAFGVVGIALPTAVSSPGAAIGAAAMVTGAAALVFSRREPARGALAER